MKPGTNQYAVANGIAFQLSWPVCVLGGSAIAVITTALVLLIHLWLIEQRRAEVFFLSTAGIFGFLFDLALFNLGLLKSSTIFPPLWMLCLWVLFATTIGFAMRWFSRHLLLAGVFAGVFAPLSYSVGAGWTEVDLRHPTWLSLVLIGSAWALVLPGMLVLRSAIEAQFRNLELRHRASGA